MGRDRACIRRHFHRNQQPVSAHDVVPGRPPKLTAGMVDKLVATTEKMTQTADSKYQVTLKMVMAALKMKCSEKTVRRALHNRGVRFHVMREKPAQSLVHIRPDFVPPLFVRPLA